MQQDIGQDSHASTCHVNVLIWEALAKSGVHDLHDPSLWFLGTFTPIWLIASNMLWLSLYMIHFAPRIFHGVGPKAQAFRISAPDTADEVEPGVPKMDS